MNPLLTLETTPVELGRVARNVTTKASPGLWQIGLEAVESWTGRLLKSSGVFEGEGIAFEVGDILFGKLRPYLAKAWVADRRGAAVGDFLVLRPLPDVRAEFLLASLLTYENISRLTRESYGSKMPRTSWEEVKRTPLQLPSPTDQDHLISQLGRETAEIDAFIADQERLIELLTERRVAQLTRVVFQGLRSASERQTGSGAWMQNVPVHWKIGNIRRFASMKTGHTPNRSTPAYWHNCDIPWFTLADVWQLRAGHKYLGKTKELISRAGLAGSAAELLPAGTVVLSRTASVGFTGIMPKAMATSQDFWNWVCGQELLPEYLWYQFQAFRPYFQTLIQGSTHKTIYKADAASMTITVPPLSEQRGLVAHLGKAMADLNAAIADAREAIALSKERRAALISAAVTGKIDVREHGKAHA